MSTSPPSIVYLQNVKIKLLARLGEVGPAIETKQREIAGLRNLRDAYERDRSLGDAGSVLEVSRGRFLAHVAAVSKGGLTLPFIRQNLFDSTHDTTLLSIAQTSLESQITLIDSALGGVLSPPFVLALFLMRSLKSPCPERRCLFPLPPPARSA